MIQAKTMLVTGGGIGIGSATAFAFARSGYRVVVTDVLEAEGRAVADAIVERASAAAGVSGASRGLERVCGAL